MTTRHVDGFAPQQKLLQLGHWVKNRTRYQAALPLLYVALNALSDWAIRTIPSMNPIIAGMPVQQNTRYAIPQPIFDEKQTRCWTAGNLPWTGPPYFGRAWGPRDAKIRVGSLGLTTSSTHFPLMAAGRVRDRVASVAIKLNDTSCPCGGVEANLFCHGFDSLGCHHGSVVSSRYVESLGMTVERMRLPP